MKVYLLQITYANKDDQEYFMPWYCDYFAFDSLEKREDKIKELMAEDDNLSDKSFHETKLEII